METEDLKEKIDKLTREIVGAVNNSGLHPLFIELILQNVIGDVKDCANKETIAMLKERINDTVATNEGESEQ